MDLHGGLVEAGKIVPQVLSLILLDVEEGVRSQTLPTADGKVEDKKVGELVEGVNGTKFQSCEPGSCRTMKSLRECLVEEGVRCSVQQHKSPKALDMIPWV